MKTTLVLGASLKPSRYSNQAVKMLKAYGHDVVAIGNQEGKIDDVTITTLENASLDKEIHTITLYLNPLRQTEYYNMILSVKPQRLIFNPGTENKKLEELAKRNNIKVENACTLVMISIGVY